MQALSASSRGFMRATRRFVAKAPASAPCATSRQLSASCMLRLSPASNLAAAARRSFASSPPPGNEDSHDDFKPQRSSPPADLDGAIKMIAEQVKKHQIMLYMKGTPARPQCGFSAQAVRILHASGVDFDSVNVLDYPMIREGVKKYSEWPTVPQLFVGGEFVGGCDIMTSLFQSGELAQILEESAKKQQKEGESAP
ncbi:glutaredoxin-like protein [Nannochloropsis gaditana CCMP526]|uniref:glutaredoxin-like protein n=1 Tax=Nannochloropsis gaditana (strain CCMP526) TaxID=1093141 RepID=UPI00029F5EC0|nr:glutaredoxin-like protein [Nannochloropsis gaditana CCMP526]EKU22741.1 glutaredoxin-like protein [Nannochloropsis gaditana CCMP526]|eukprot:XP_005853615.1 glutaredoxin-like protein [Nannochloropsis gaditana CCMP526]